MNDLPWHMNASTYPHPHNPLPYPHYPLDTTVASSPAGRRLWFDGSGYINTIADGIRVEAIGQPNFEMFMEHAEKDVYTVVGPHRVPRIDESTSKRPRSDECLVGVNRRVFVFWVEKYEEKWEQVEHLAAGHFKLV